MTPPKRGREWSKKISFVFDGISGVKKEMEGVKKV